MKFINIIIVMPVMTTARDDLKRPVFNSENYQAKIFILQSEGIKEEDEETRNKQLSLPFHMYIC